MDKRIWGIITKVIVSVNRAIPRTGRRPSFNDVLILRMYVWTVWHDRPLYWACDRLHYNKLFRPRRLPSVSQFCRRVRTPRVALMLQELGRRLAWKDGPDKVMFLDGKALPVSESTSDPEAKTGRGNGRFSRGYKLHALGAQDGRITAFSVRSLNEHELPVTHQALIQHVSPGAIVLADGNYDSDRLYQQMYDQNAWLFTPMKGKRARSQSRLGRMSLPRRWIHDLWGRRTKLCWAAYRERTGIERMFSALSLFCRRIGTLAELGSPTRPRSTLGYGQASDLPRSPSSQEGYCMMLHAKSSTAPGELRRSARFQTGAGAPEQIVPSFL